MAGTLGNDVVIKVTTAELYAKSQSISQLLSRMQGNFQGLKVTVDKTGNYWIGEAGDAHREMYREMVPHIEEIAQRLQEHIRELQEIAGVYEETEHQVQELAESLPSDVIV